jgi:hypothetical protein
MYFLYVKKFEFKNFTLSLISISIIKPILSGLVVFPFFYDNGINNHKNKGISIGFVLIKKKIVKEEK